MENSKTYLDIMITSLKQKIKILEEISKQNQIQMSSVNADEIDYDKFDETIQAKEQLIIKLDELDTGFEQLYNRLKHDIVLFKHNYAEEIKEMQQLIKHITDLTMKVQVEESKNKEVIYNKTTIARKEIHQARQSNKAVANYYKNMSKLNVVDAQFMDSKR